MEHVFGAIPSVLRVMDTNAVIDEAVVFSSWGRCAGDLLQIRTAPIVFNEKRLVIAVADQTWKRHLEELCPQMLVKLNGSLGQGAAKFIEFRIDPKAIKKRPETGGARQTAEKRVEQLAKPLRDAAKAIADEHLRDHFLETAAVYLDRQRRN